MKQKIAKVCAFCNGSGIVRLVGENPSVDYETWCKCDTGEQKFHTVAEIVGEQGIRIRAA